MRLQTLEHSRPPLWPGAGDESFSMNILKVEPSYLPLSVCLWRQHFQIRILDSSFIVILCPIMNKGNFCQPCIFLESLISFVGLIHPHIWIEAVGLKERPTRYHHLLLPGRMAETNLSLALRSMLSNNKCLLLRRSWVHCQGNLVSEGWSSVNVLVDTQWISLLYRDILSIKGVHLLRSQLVIWLDWFVERGDISFPACALAKRGI